MYRYDTNWYMSGSNATIEITDLPKYEEGSEVIEELRYKDVDGFEVISGEKAEELERLCDIDEDENHEYLRIYMNNGETATFRNSHAILFNI